MKHITKYELFESSSNGLSKEQIEFLDKCIRGTWKLNSTTGLVDIDGNFNCSNEYLKNFKGIRFGNVSGNFYCYSNQLTSLEGSPQKVGRGFYCDHNNLTSLEGAPQEVRGGFYCHGNKLTSLEGAPQEVGKDFYCSGNQLTSLEGAPQKLRGDFYCTYNKLTSLEGAPQEVGEGFYCDDFQTYNWSLEWQIENLEKYPILATIASPEILQKFINENPTKATITLRKIWKDLMKNPNFKHLKFPTSHKEDIDLLSDLSDLGL